MRLIDNNPWLTWPRCNFNKTKKKPYKVLIKEIDLNWKKKES